MAELNYINVDVELSCKISEVIQNNAKGIIGKNKTNKEVRHGGAKDPFKKEIRCVRKLAKHYSLMITL